MIGDRQQHFGDLEQVEYPWLVPDLGSIHRTFELDEAYLVNPWSRGVRHLDHDEADAAWLVRPAEGA